MSLYKPRPDYITIPPDFSPLPKYGHLSSHTPDYAAAEAGIRAMYAALMGDAADLPSCRAAAGDPDAPMPPCAGGGGDGTVAIDRYAECETELREFEARDGAAVELKVYRGKTAMGRTEGSPWIYRMHGGGWSVGSHEVDGTENVFAAVRGGVVVVSVKYRLAPEHPFPCGFHDCYDGLLWCINNASELGLDPNKIIIGGSSAGGNLAAALTLETRDAGKEFPGTVIAQVLHFPILCHPALFPRDRHEFGSYVQNRGDAVLGALQMELVLDAYLPPGRGQPLEADQRHSPLLAATLEGLPPTLIQCAGADPLRDEGLAYAEDLASAGVDVEMHVYKGVPHCFPAVLSGAPEATAFYERFGAFLAKYVR